MTHDDDGPRRHHAPSQGTAPWGPELRRGSVRLPFFFNAIARRRRLTLDLESLASNPFR